ncbi:histidinol-phosphate transaminase [Gephyromycinifex aptenodytis]|uniref:histidinol-phosphate transaminase n=1 Tax=Gephyromycinifex aptenodytis TaxID=2716227 RepID=UPI0014461327|nr:histidinol-phosphate transaminase [Gephyromycinifex aptenodytis]
MSQDIIDELLREDLRGRSPYGAPQLQVPVALNTNENSYPVPEQVVESITQAVAQVAAGLNRYPDREFSQLRDALAQYLSRTTAVPLNADQLWAGNGSNEVLLHLVQAFGGPGRSALGFTPAYSMHPIITRTAGTEWIDGLRGARPQDREADGETGSADFDLLVEHTAEQAREHDPSLIFLCSPNNPTGTSLCLEVITACYEAAPRAIIVVDEAYAEFARAGTPSAMTLLQGRPRLVVTRTLSKAFALAGGRLGYLAADPALVDALRLVRMPYHLSSLTQVLATTVLGYTDLMLGRVDEIKQQRDRIVAELTRLGYRPVPSDANFVLFGGIQDSPALWQALLDEGVLVRDVGLPGYLRVTAGTPAETDAFLAAMTRLGGPSERQQA